MLYGFIYEQFPVQNIFVKTKYKSMQSEFIITVRVLCPSTQTTFLSIFINKKIMHG